MLLACALSLLPCIAAAKVKKIAVLELHNLAQVRDQEAVYLADIVRAEALRSSPGRFFVMTRENILELLDPGTDLGTCIGRCELETGRNIGADLLVSGEIVQFGQSLRVLLKLYDTHTGGLLANAKASAIDVEGLEAPVERAAQRLIAALLPPASASEDRPNRGAPAGIGHVPLIQPDDDTVRYLTDLERRWATIRRRAPGFGDAQNLESYRRFLIEFAVDNPYAEHARSEIARIEHAQSRPQSAASAEVRQPGTELVWMRCPVGQSWDGVTCQGMPAHFGWDDARRGCPPGFRTPTRQELVGLLGGCDSDVLSGRSGQCHACASSSRCAAMFGPDRGAYWSSTSTSRWTWSYDGWYAMFLEMRSGKGFIDYRSDRPHFLRCVRQAKPLDR